MHVALFGYVSKDLQERLSWLWSEKYEVGSVEHGLDFSVKSVKESIQSVRNYLMKYITKGIGGEGRKKWTVEEWVYHAITSITSLPHHENTSSDTPQLHTSSLSCHAYTHYSNVSYTADDTTHPT